MAVDLKKKAISGIVWGFFERFSIQLFVFIQGIILARLLTPSDYGLVAMATVFNMLSNTLVDSGFATSLIRKKNRTALDYSTVFVTNIGISIVLAILLCCCSPIIAIFYNEPKLSGVINANAVLLFLGSFTVVPLTRLQADMAFKVRSIIRMTNAIASGIAAIIMALMGYGVWSLIYPGYLNVLFTIGLLWYFQHWFPGFRFSKSSFKELFSFGSRMLMASFLNVLYGNIYPIVIGKKYTSSDLGYFTKARTFSNLPSTTATNMLGDITFPLLSEIQDDNRRLKTTYRQLIRLSVLVIFPIMIGIAAVAKPLILFLITDKWAQSILYLQILCFAMMWYPVHALNVNLLKVKGRSDMFLRLEIIKKIVGLGVLILSVPFGIVWMCLGSVVSSLLCLFINTYYTGKLINVGFLTQMRDIFPYFLISLIMGGVVYFTCQSISHIGISLLIGVLLGICIYISLLKLIKSQDFDYLVRILKGFFYKKHNFEE